MIRILITSPDTTDPQSLLKQLVRKPGSASGTLDQLKALNPHVNFSKLAAGTVLLVPDVPDLKPGATAAVGGDNVDELRDRITAGIAMTVSNVSSGAERIAADRKEVASAVKAAATKRVIESDPLLQQRLAAADETFKATQKQTAEAQAALAELQKLAAKEFDRLQTLLGA